MKRKALYVLVHEEARGESNIRKTEVERRMIRVIMNEN